MPQPIGDTDFVEAHKDYPAEARRLGIEGQVKVRLVVDATGKVASRAWSPGSATASTSSPSAGQQAALQARPSTPAIEPVPAVVVWTFTFTLPQ